MSSSAQRKPNATFFVDRSVGRSLAKRLRDNGYLAIAHDERFAQDLVDQEWLLWAGEQRLIVVTQDKKIRYRQAELAAFKAAGVLAFIVASGNCRGETVIELIPSRQTACWRWLRSNLDEPPSRSISAGASSSSISLDRPKS